MMLGESIDSKAVIVIFVLAIILFLLVVSILNQQQKIDDLHSEVSNLSTEEKQINNSMPDFSNNNNTVSIPRSKYEEISNNISKARERKKNVKENYSERISQLEQRLEERKEQKDSIWETVEYKNYRAKSEKLKLESIYRAQDNVLEDDMSELAAKQNNLFSVYRELYWRCSESNNCYATRVSKPKSLQNNT